MARKKKKDAANSVLVLHPLFLPQNHYNIMPFSAIYVTDFVFAFPHFMNRRRKKDFKKNII